MKRHPAQERNDVRSKRAVNAEPGVSLAALIVARPATAGKVKVVSIDGHGGAGKSSLADLLAGSLGAEVVHTDDFASWDDPTNWWSALIDHVLGPIAAGVNTLSYPRSQWWPEHRPEPVVEQAVTDVLIVEGVGSLRHQFRPYVTVGLFVAATREICLERGTRRDAAMGGVEEIRGQWETWYREEEAYIEREHPDVYADLVLDGTRPFEDQLWTPISLRTFSQSDQEAVRSLIQAGMQERWGAGYDSAANPDTDDIWNGYVRGGAEVVVAEASNRVVGTGMLLTEPDGSGRIRRLSVSRDWRRLGIGRQIVEELCARAATRDLTPVRVRTDSPWTDALRFYEACGFEAVHRGAEETELLRTI